MSTLLRRVGGAAARHPWRTLGAWLLALFALFGLQSALGGQPHDNYNIPNTESQAGTAFLAHHFPQLSGADARVVVHGRDGRRPAPTVLATIRTNLARMPGAAVVDPAQMSADGNTALITVHYGVPVTDFHGSEAVDALRAAGAPAETAGLQVEFGGSVPENFSAPNGVAEGVGITAALIILVLTLGSVVAAGLPLVVAIGGLGAGTAIIGLLCAVTDISTTAPTVATMVGLGVGIDYALLLVSRHVEGLHRGLSPVEAAARATGTAGTSVVIAGLTVLVSLLGLKLATLPVYTSFGYATFATVGSVILAAITLVPALCALAGRRLLPRRQRRGGTTVAHGLTTGGSTRIERWAGRIARRPLVATLAALAVLALLAAPVLAMRTWPQDAGTAPTSNTTRRAYDLVTAQFGPGANGPLVLAVDLTRLPSPQNLVATLSADPGVARVVGPVSDANGTAAVIVVEPTTGPQDPATTALLRRIRGQVPDGVLVTGTVAVYADISARLASRLWVVIGFVVALSLILLTVLLRAPIAAAKAATMNLISVAAAYGVVTAVFQTNIGAHLIGLPHASPVSSWIPILMFAVLFGLSMDYEVFLLARIREYWVADGDAVDSVRRGLGASARVITTAAAIMVAVFLGFALDPDVTVKTLGIGMAVAVFIDATLVRMVLVPAVMALLGRASWWLPRWLDHILPRAADRDTPHPHTGDHVEPKPELAQI
jgi:RND superfamily putative drug exporter